ncbi:hypothetical protein [Cognatishimia sp. F0-27]|uniref:hypothetical protein n=1 Tax=Cognatishimia sp. F0-27 TaxID=2816855 RepID=UPI001D0C788D|nr:hypothetical protein [Cognatishimia sp. F0-27]
MIRPEAAAMLKRWRGVLIAATLVLLGVYWALWRGTGLLEWVGYAMAGAGIGLGITAVQRLRFDQGHGGPGVVSVVEGRITYFGPLGGGVADLEALSAITFDPRAKPAHWLLAQPGQPSLAIPANAEGAQALFDAFAHLPGLRIGALVDATRASTAPVLVWQRDGTGPAPRTATSAHGNRPRRLH